MVFRISNFDIIIATNYDVCTFMCYTEFPYLPPPQLPSNYVNREILLDEITTKLLQATNVHDKYGTTLTVVGPGGCGKTTVITALCYHPVVRDHFTAGFLFIELGPQALNLNIKLRAICNLLTDKKCDINIAEQQINQLTSGYYRNLLVIIDDVQHLEDAEPLVKAFSNCKTIFITRMNEIKQHIPTKQLVIVGSLMQNETISLLTSGVIDSTQLTQQDVNSINKLVQDFSQWPLLLFLIKGLLSHNLKQHSSFHNAIKNLLGKLHGKGLKAALNKSSNDNINAHYKLAMKIFIGITLELLPKSLLDRLKSLILWTGIGTPVQRTVLNILWKISNREAEDSLQVLWNYGLIQFTDITITHKSNIQHCVEVHAIISQCIVDCMDSNEVCFFSPHGKVDEVESVNKALLMKFQQTCGIYDSLSPTAMEFLKYKLSEIENYQLPLLLKGLSAQIVVDPHHLILGLQYIKHNLTQSRYAVHLLSLLGEEINSLITESKRVSGSTQELCRKLYQRVKTNLYEKSYDELIENVQAFMKTFPLCNVAQNAIALVEKIMPHCHGELLFYMMERYEYFQLKTYDYHPITTLMLPFIKLEIKFHERITSSVMHGSPNIEATRQYFENGTYQEEYESLEANHLIILKSVVPNYVRQQGLE